MSCSFVLDVGNETVLATNLGETTDSFIADMVRLTFMTAISFDKASTSRSHWAICHVDVVCSVFSFV